MNDAFRKAAHRASILVGSPLAFTIAVLLVVVWAATGPVLGFTNTWQLAINTCTTIVTVLMVFLIQNTQNRDSRALHMKLDELIIYTQGADNEMVELENLSEEQLDHLEQRFHQLAKVLGKNGNINTNASKATTPRARRGSRTARSR